MSQIIETVKKHPYITAGAIAAALALFLIFSASSGGSQQTTSNSGVSLDAQAAEVQAATQLQGQQLSAQLQNNQTQAEANIASQNIAAQVTIAGIQSTTSQNNNYISTQGNITLAGIQADVTKAVSSLQAAVAENSSDNQLSQIQTIIGGNVQQSQIQANEATDLASINADTTKTLAAANAGGNAFGQLLGFASGFL